MTSPQFSCSPRILDCSWLLFVCWFAFVSLCPCDQAKLSECCLLRSEVHTRHVITGSLSLGKRDEPFACAFIFVCTVVMQMQWDYCLQSVALKRISNAEPFPIENRDEPQDITHLLLTTPSRLTPSSFSSSKSPVKKGHQDSSQCSILSVIHKQN